MDRRTVIRGTGIALALPILEATSRCHAHGSTTVRAPMRMVVIHTTMGIMPRYFFPKKLGHSWEETRYLKMLRDFRGELTILSGVSHPDVDGGHAADVSFLTAAPHPGRGGFTNTISLDQLAAEQVGLATRFPSITLEISNESAMSLSYTAAGVMIPGERSPSELFKRLFVKGTQEETRRRINDLQRGLSILDFVRDDAKRLSPGLSTGDRQRMDQYFSSIRELENRLRAAEKWETRPKPRVLEKVPNDIDDPNRLIARTESMLQVIRLALQTDSSRIVTLMINPAYIRPPILGVESPIHPLTHHGNRNDKIAQLARIEEAQFGALASFLRQLKSTSEGEGTLFDHTMVLYGTSMGNANAHSNHNLPVLLAGGGFKHAGHLAFDSRRGHNYPLANLYVSMLQKLGIETDRFASGTSTLRGLEL